MEGLSRVMSSIKGKFEVIIINHIPNLKGNLEYSELAILNSIYRNKKLKETIQIRSSYSEIIKLTDSRIF